MLGFIGFTAHSPPSLDRIWGIWGSHNNIPKTVFYLLKGDYMGSCQNYGPFLGPLN